MWNQFTRGDGRAIEGGKGEAFVGSLAGRTTILLLIHPKKHLWVKCTKKTGNLYKKLLLIVENQL